MRSSVALVEDCGRPPRILAVCTDLADTLAMGEVLRSLRRDRRLEVRAWAVGERALVRSLAETQVAIDRKIDPGEALHCELQWESEATDRLRRELAAEKPSFVLIRGENAAVASVLLAAFAEGIPVARMGAGLRADAHGEDSCRASWRVLADRLCSLHFAHDEAARQRLHAERVASRGVHVTGDPLDAAVAALARGSKRAPEFCDRSSGRGRARGPRVVVALSGRIRTEGAAALECARRACRALHGRTLFVDGLDHALAAAAAESAFAGETIVVLRSDDGLLSHVAGANLLITDRADLLELACKLGIRSLELLPKGDRPRAFEIAPSRVRSVAPESARHAADHIHALLVGTVLSPSGKKAAPADADVPTSGAKACAEGRRLVRGVRVLVSLP